MTTTQIAYFLELAKCMSFTKASENLYISQPALSRHIISLETELNTQLFVRSGNTIRLTAAGQLFLEDISKIYADYTALLHKLEAISIGTSLRIGFLEEQLMNASVLHALTWFYTYHPEVKISVEKNTFGSLMSMLSDGQIDIAVTMSFMLAGRANLDSRVISENSLYLAASRKLPISELDEIRIRDLPRYLGSTSYLLVDPNDAAPANQHQLADLAAEGVIPEHIVYAPSESMMALWVASGMGVAVMPENHVLFHDPSVKFIPFLGMPKTSTVLVWHQSNSNEVLRQFVDCVLLSEKIGTSVARKHPR